MIRSMFTAINALFVHQQYMDVVSDNLANVNTPGYKYSYMSFTDQFAQTLSYGTSPSATRGGTNPVQIGLGSTMGTVSQVFTNGGLQGTGRDLDLAIQGDGFFVYDANGSEVYSRDGNLIMDSMGFLVNASTGYRIQGWQADVDTGAIESGGALTAIRIPVDSAVALQTNNVTVVGNLNATGNRVAPSNPPLAGEDNLANYRVTFGVYDSLGEMQEVELMFVRTDQADGTPLEWEVHWMNNPTAPATEVPLYDKANFDAAYPPLQITAGENPPGTLSNLTFNEYGQIDYTAQRVVLTNVPGSAGTTPHDITIDLSGMTQLTGEYTAAASSQDGLAGGGLSGFIISESDGTIYGVYANGAQRAIGQVGMATFNNSAGLVRQGDNTYALGLNSGLPRISPAATGDKGTIASGYIEGSNVDMSREFTNMILAQRGFQASSRIINTADEMLQELVNLKR